MKNILIFGANGSVGNYIFTQFNNENEKYKVIGTTTNIEKINENIIYVENNFLKNLLLIENIDIIIWAQGHNFNDNIDTFNINNFMI